MKQLTKQLTIPYELTLPYPVSTNRYWRRAGNRIILSDDGKKFKATVISEYGYLCKTTDKDVSLTIRIHAKTTKKGIASKSCIDIDNCTKSVLDSLIGLVYVDDKQVKKLTIEYGEPVEGGATTVKVYEIYKDLE